MPYSIQLSVVGWVHFSSNHFLGLTSNFSRSFLDRYRAFYLDPHQLGYPPLRHRLLYPKHQIDLDPNQAPQRAWVLTLHFEVSFHLN